MLIEHPSLVGLSGDLRSCLVKMLSPAKGKSEEVQVSPAEHRAHSIFSRVAEVDNCLRSLRIAVAGLQAEAKSASPDVEQYRYHVENYLLRLTGLYDRACRLAGVAIGMTSAQVDRQRGNSEVLGALKRLKAQRPLETLAELKALLEPHWDTRNVVAHAGEFSSRQIGLFVAVSQMQLASVDSDGLHKLMTAHFQDGALDFGVLALRAEGLLYCLIESLTPSFGASSTNSANDV
jgi:hypothetical protein